ncbi:MAG: helix-turn-helix transcriptional regulator [Acidimicrobiales bacterium]
MNELEQRWRDLGEFIREQRRIDRLSLRKLSEMAGVSNPYLSQIERGLRKPSAEILQQIARALEISAESLYVRAGILDEADLEHDLVAAIRRDTNIDEDQKKTLIHIYESFVAEREARSAGVLRSAAELPGPGPDLQVSPRSAVGRLDEPDPADVAASRALSAGGEAPAPVPATPSTDDDVESLADVQR